MGVGTEDIEAADSLAISQPQIVANFQDLGYSGSGGYKETAALTATAAGTTTLTVASLRTQIFTGSTTQIVVMPVTSTLAVGYQYLIINNSTGVVTINSSGGNLIVTLGAGTRILLTCILITGTTAASWDILNNLQVPGNVVLTGGLTAVGTIATGNTKVVNTGNGSFITANKTDANSSLSIRINEADGTTIATIVNFARGITGNSFELSSASGIYFSCTQAGNLTLTGRIKATLATYANNAAAISAGLVAGDMYKVNSAGSEYFVAIVV